MNAETKNTTADKNIDPFGQPIFLAAHYTDVHREQVAEIIDWLAAANTGVTDKKKLKTQSWLVRVSRLNASTVNQVLHGKYASPPDAQLRAMLDAIRDYERKVEYGGTHTYVKTGITRTIHNVCSRAAAVGSFGIITGFVGVGKTAGLKEYAAHNSHAFLIEADPSMTVGVLLDSLMEALKIGVNERFGKNRSAAARFKSIVEELKGTSSLLIFDEAETMSHRCLHEIRRIRDKANIGIVLAGTEKLTSLISPMHGEFDQIRSRVCLWPETIKTISRADADALAQSALDEQGELDAPVIDALWQYSKGSARMLMENLIPAVKDYGIGKGQAFGAELVHAIAQQVLNLKAA